MNISFTINLFSPPFELRSRLEKSHLVRMQQIVEVCNTLYGFSEKRHKKWLPGRNICTKTMKRTSAAKFVYMEKMHLYSHFWNVESSEIKPHLNNWIHITGWRFVIWKNSYQIKQGSIIWCLPSAVYLHGFY